jgi:hypothetical protein
MIIISVKDKQKLNNEPLDDLNDLINELKTTKSLTGLMVPPKTITTVPEKVDENNVDDFIFRKSSELIQQGVDAIESIKSSILSGANADSVEAYSKLMSSVTGSIEILNKINLQKRKERAAKELKQMELDSSSKLLDKYDNGTTIKNQTNFIVATREEVMKALLDKAEALTMPSKDIIDVPGD